MGVRSTDRVPEAGRDVSFKSRKRSSPAIDPLNRFSQILCGLLDRLQVSGQQK
jgi:hypothetical protein